MEVHGMEDDSDDAQIQFRPSTEAFDWNGLTTVAGVNNEGDEFQCLGAFAGDNLVGSVIYQDTGDFLWVEHLFVLPQYRRKGIGEGLVRRIMSNHPGKKLEGSWRSPEMEELANKLAESDDWKDVTSDIDALMPRLEFHRNQQDNGWIKTISRKDPGVLLVSDPDAQGLREVRYLYGNRPMWTKHMSDEEVIDFFRRTRAPRSLPQGFN